MWIFRAQTEQEHYLRDELQGVLTAGRAANSPSGLQSTVTCNLSSRLELIDPSAESGLCRSASDWTGSQLVGYSPGNDVIFYKKYGTLFPIPAVAGGAIFFVQA